MTLGGIKKRLGNFSLDIENLVIPGPGIYGLLGPNGSGKTTLAKIMAGLMAPDLGNICSDGIGARDITMLSRKPYMMDDTVYNNLVFPLRLRKIKPDPGIVADYLEKRNLSDRKKQNARLLSGGEQQKLAFFRALIFRPRFIIADEAMTALDIDSLDLFERTILDEQKKDPVVWIIISHQMPQLMQIADYIFFMHRGRIEAEGPVKDIFAGPSNPYLKQYLRVYGGGIAGEVYQ